MSRNLIRGFLFLYICLLGYQLLALSTVPLQMWAVFSAGFIAAVFTHRRAGVLALAALVAHLIIESYYHAKHGFAYGGMTSAFYLMHAVFDLTFLVYQSWEVSKKHYMSIVGAVLLTLLMVGFVAYQPPMLSFAAYLQQDHSHVPSILGFLIFGSIIGCAFMHGLSVKNKA